MPATAKNITDKKLRGLPAGGALAGKRNGQTIIHKDGSLGGYAVGRMHSKGGIKGVVKTNGDKVEFQGNEVVVTAPAVADNTLHDFNGEMLTNRQILSRINESGGGVSFADGGEVPKSIKTTGAMHRLYGINLPDNKIASHCGCHHSMARGGRITDARLKKAIALIKKLKPKAGLISSMEIGVAKAHPAEFLEMVADQALGYIRAGGKRAKIHYSGGQREQSNEKFGKELTDLAIEMYPLEKREPKTENKFTPDFVGKHLHDILYSDEGFELLESDEDLKEGTWAYGACYPLALALQQLLGGELKMMYDRNTYNAEHVMLFVDGKYIDSDGISGAQRKINIAKEADGKSEPFIGDFDLGAIERHSFGVGAHYFPARLAAFITEKLENVEPKTDENNFAAGGKMKYDHDGDAISDYQEKVLFRLHLNPDSYTVVSTEDFILLKPLREKSLIYETKHHGKPGDLAVRLTDEGREFVSGHSFKTENKAIGGVIDSGIAKPSTDYKYYRGLDAKYKNPYELNRAIEELVDGIAPGTIVSPDVKSFLSLYSGYGGLEKFGASGKGLLYEYFTPDRIVEKMWGLAYKFGFEGGKVLEPSCGVGAFIKLAPEQNMVSGYEINEYSHKICRLLFPAADINHKSFETLFIKHNSSVKNKVDALPKFKLVIGNPPYGEFGGIYAGMGEKSYSKADNYIDYFIFRGLDLLEKNGLLIYIIGTEVANGGKPWLQKPANKIKQAIMEKSNLLIAYRLPNGVFDRTDVLSDIIVLQKK